MLSPAAQAKQDSVMFTANAPVIDGVANDAAWKEGDWHDMTSLMWGTNPEPSDFSGRYKLRWDKKALYLLAEIQDDHLSDTYANPLERYWDDDFLEIFIDADASGGDHLNNYNAFAYLLALDNQVVDIGPNEAGEAVQYKEGQHTLDSLRLRQVPRICSALFALGVLRASSADLGLLVSVLPAAQRCFALVVYRGFRSALGAENEGGCAVENPRILSYPGCLSHEEALLRREFAGLEVQVGVHHDHH